MRGGTAWQFYSAIGAALETTTFTALCEHAGRWWTIHVPQIDGLTTQVRSLDQAEVVTRQLISRSLGVPPEAIRVDVVPNAPAPLADALQKRYAARVAADTANQATRDAIGVLVRGGYAFPDVAAMLGLSPAEITLFGPVGGASGRDRPSASSGPLQLAGQ